MLESVENNLDLIIGQAGFLLPEMILVIGCIVMLFLDMMKNSNKAVNLVIFLIALISAGIFSFIQQFPFNEFRPLMVWDVLIIDRASLFFQLIFLLATAVYGIAFWRRATGLDYFLAIGLLIGAFIVVKSVDLLVLIVGIEILSITAYSFTAKQTNELAKEAALKYIIFGAISTAIFLFGLSLVYGLTGELNISSEIFIEQLIVQDSLVLLVVFLFVLAGLFFKITAFPFHLWAPDVYQTVPAPLAALFSIVPKIAVIGFMIKFFMAINLFGIVEVPWKETLGIIAIITMTVGNLAALSQKDPQRMMAYSSIAHTGFLLMGIVAFHEFGFQSILFYTAIYLFMNLLAFLLIDYYQRIHHVKTIDGFKGKFNASALMGVVLLLAMIALTGLPPTAGFTAKFLIFSSAWQSYQDTEAYIYIALLIAGALNSILSLFYYLKIPFYLIFRKEEIAEIAEPQRTGAMNFLVVILVLPLIILFIWPDLLMDWINMVNFAL